MCNSGTKTRKRCVALGSDLNSADPFFQSAFIQCLEEHGWTADTQLEEPSISLGPPIEEFKGSIEERDDRILEQLKEVASARKALLVRNSHMGGHKYAGNCIVSATVSPSYPDLTVYQIYTPQGSSIWYGRVTTHEVESIVVNTILGGLVLPPLLRGGLNISRPGCSTLHDW